AAAAAISAAAPDRLCDDPAGFMASGGPDAVGCDSDGSAITARPTGAADRNRLGGRDRRRVAAVAATAADRLSNKSRGAVATGGNAAMIALRYGARRALPAGAGPSASGKDASRTAAVAAAAADGLG